MKNNIDLAKLLHSHGLDTVDGAFKYNGGLDMTIPGLGHRQRWTLDLCDDQGSEHVLFMKRYGAEPLKWVLHRWFTYGIGGSPASVEHQCIEKLHNAGIETILQSFARHEMNGLFASRSFIILSKVPGEALEQCLQPFLEKNDLESDKTRIFSQKLVDLISRFHAAGFVHRDLYTSHVFMNEQDGALSLCLIDLARMFAPRLRKFRWRVKDLAQLKFSMPDEWLEKYWRWFIDTYCEKVGISHEQRKQYEMAIDGKIKRIALHDAKKRVRREKMQQGERCK